ncbi:MAG TPA: hypothetical protein VFF52_15105 [Isosphaeraceae bacterium]|nr:hypothetical protein [Isosphaeraceae bacterium]
MRLPQLSPAVDRRSALPNGAVRGEVQPQNGCPPTPCASDTNCPANCPYCVLGFCEPYK